MTATDLRLPALLDVNVLIALVWPNHEGHRAARTWFAQSGDQGWATTPFTETGFVRVSCNRRALPTTTSPSLAVEMLRTLTALPGHTFWPDSVQLVTGQHVDPAELSGHRQVTDAHLVALCLHHAGRLVTFDRAIGALAPADGAMVELLDAD